MTINDGLRWALVLFSLLGEANNVFIRKGQNNPNKDEAWKPGSSSFVRIFLGSSQELFLFESLRVIKWNSYEFSL